LSDSANKIWNQRGFKVWFLLGATSDPCFISIDITGDVLDKLQLGLSGDDPAADASIGQKSVVIPRLQEVHAIVSH
jgi:hypothetical protein